MTKVISISDEVAEILGNVRNLYHISYSEAIKKLRGPKKNVTTIWEDRSCCHCHGRTPHVLNEGNRWECLVCGQLYWESDDP